MIFLFPKGYIDEEYKAEDAHESQQVFKKKTLFKLRILQMVIDPMTLKTKILKFIMAWY